MVLVKALACDVCKEHSPSLEVESYKIHYPDGVVYPVDLCPEHAAVLVKLRDALPEPKPRRGGGGRKSPRKPMTPLD